ncbi:hypothetical protein [Flavivirga spongiicola]|uniref:Uncharacterized protein n=1 Tax=Flavivirga spongiicola TaxID=421621 RepID=A0ABU7XNJ9_9FLAO|nr:hypothetical protein [Flavivirga sp. MEBiC05379]MDO5977331.1 hypothetical protein [Flavivirga sp. MEBiC05379]
MESKEELVKKWDTFLSKIEERFDLIIDQSKEGTQMLIDQITYDSVSIINAWNGVQSQLLSLMRKTDDTWANKMEQSFEAIDYAKYEDEDENYDENENYDEYEDDATDKERMEQYNKYHDLNHKMLTKYKFESNRAFANAARKIQENVMAHIDLNKIHNCKQCGDIMDITIYSFMAKNVKCRSCGTVNSYEPDDRILAIEHNCVIHLANEHVIDLTIKEANLEHELLKLDRWVTDEKTKMDQIQNDLNKNKVEYINKYYDFIVELVPDKEAFYNRKRVHRLEQIK